MYDAANPSKIPDGSFVAGYVNGAYAWTAEEWARFGQHLGIDVTGTAPLMSNVLDVEPGNLGTAESGDDQVWTKLLAAAVAWARVRVAHHLSVTLYVEGSRFSTLAAGMQEAGIAARYWVADWGMTQDDAETKVGGPIAAVQFQGGTDAPYDLSVAADDWFPPASPPRPELTGLSITGIYSDSTTSQLWVGKI
jgi:hypothetical protein